MVGAILEETLLATPLSSPIRLLFAKLAGTNTSRAGARSTSGAQGSKQIINKKLSSCEFRKFSDKDPLLGSYVRSHAFPVGKSSKLGKDT